MEKRKGTRIRGFGPASAYKDSKDKRVCRNERTGTYPKLCK